MTYGAVWLYILGNVGDEITFMEISKKCGGISKSYISEIVKWGLKKMRVHQIDFDYSNSRSGIVFSFTIGKAIVPKNESLITEIIAYLNDKSGKHFSSTSKETTKVIVYAQSPYSETNSILT